MSTTIHRHPDAETLMSYAAGALAEPLSAVVAAHLSMCEGCLIETADMELIGSVLLTAPAGGLEAVRGVAVPPRPAEQRGTTVAVDAGHAARGRLPMPIAARYGLSFETIPWKRLAPGVLHHRLAVSPGVDGDLRLLKIAPGCTMPEHGHSGTELTLVLDGAYADETGEYRAGDVQDADAEVEHTPVTDRDHGCVCLIASEGPARFKGLIAKLIQPWTGL